jgi:hypothetical protein
MNSRRRISALALPLVAGAAITLMPTTAQAAPQAASVTLCSDGSFASVLQWPSRGGLETTVVNPGDCNTWADLTSGVEQVKVLTSTQDYIGTFQLDGSRNVTVTTVDTANGPSFYVA